MPCDSSHLQPTQREAHSLALVGFLREAGILKGKYDQCYGRVDQLDTDTAALCAYCQKHDVTQMSLELQIWWRDHQKADKAKARKREAAVALKCLRQQALKKLTPSEIRALGVDDGRS